MQKGVEDWSLVSSCVQDRFNRAVSVHYTQIYDRSLCWPHGHVLFPLDRKHRNTGRREKLPIAHMSI